MYRDPVKGNIRNVRLFYDVFLTFKNLDRLQTVLRLYSYNISEENLNDFNKVMDILSRKYNTEERDLEGVWQYLKDITSEIQSITSVNKQIFKAIPEEDRKVLSLKNPFLNLPNNLITKDTVNEIINTLKLTDDRSKGLAFDIISLHGNVELINKISKKDSKPQLLLSSDLVKLIINEFKGLNLRWLKYTVDKIELNAEQNIKWIRLCILDVATIFNTLGWLRKRDDLARDGLFEMAKWIMESMIDKEFIKQIDNLKSQLSSLVEYYDYYDMTGKMNGIHDYSIEIRRKFY